MKLENVKEEMNSVWEDVVEGWQHLRQSAAGALTRFKPGAKTDLPAREQVGDEAWAPVRGWAMLGGDVFEDKDKLMVRLEIPGMAKEDVDIEVIDGAVVVSGEKRFEQESTEGHWRVMQCAYGAFRRVVPLPTAVKADTARATYKDGVLRIELPKADPGLSKQVVIKVE